MQQGEVGPTGSQGNKLCREENLCGFNLYLIGTDDSTTQFPCYVGLTGPPGPTGATGPQGKRLPN